MRLYIIRHADPDYENNTITDKGHREAEALARYLETESIDQIYSSPLGRALDTASYYEKRSGLKAEVLDWTRELNLFIESDDPRVHVSWDVDGAQLRTDFQESEAVREERLRVEEASDRFFADLGLVREGCRYRVEQALPKRVAVFCHGGFGLTWLSHLLGIPLLVMWAAYWLPPSSVSIVLMDERQAGYVVPRCIGMALTAHLYEAALPIQPRGIIANFD